VIRGVEHINSTGGCSGRQFDISGTSDGVGFDGRIPWLVGGTVTGVSVPLILSCDLYISMIL
jgi:hypothetical protein